MDKKLVMISGDKDWVQLLRPNVVWIDPMRDARLTSKNISTRLGYVPEKGRFSVCKSEDVTDFIGVPSPRAWLEIKALMGDISDNIPGVGGIGPRGAIDLITTYGSVGSFFNQVADKTINVGALTKKLRDFATSEEKHDIFRRNMQLMDLSSPERPEWINPKIVHGAIDPDKFSDFCKRMLFNSIVKDLDGWLEPFTGNMMEKAA
jgi:5'-3' exonuclease